MEKKLGDEQEAALLRGRIQVLREAVGTLSSRRQVLIEHAKLRCREIETELSSELRHALRGGRGLREDNLAVTAEIAALMDEKAKEVRRVAAEAQARHRAVRGRVRRRRRRLRARAAARGRSRR